MGNITKQRREIHETMMVRSCLCMSLVLALWAASFARARFPVLRFDKRARAGSVVRAAAALLQP